MNRFNIHSIVVAVVVVVDFYLILSRLCSYCCLRLFADALPFFFFLVGQHSLLRAINILLVVASSSKQTVEIRSSISIVVDVLLLTAVFPLNISRFHFGTSSCWRPSEVESWRCTRTARQNRFFFCVFFVYSARKVIRSKTAPKRTHEKKYEKKK